MVKYCAALYGAEERGKVRIIITVKYSVVRCCQV